MNEHSAEDSSPKPGKKRGLSLGFGCGIVVLILAGPLLLQQAGTRTARESAQRKTCLNNLRNIGVALLNYHTQWETFPPAHTVDAEGRPLHSWRVLILPLLDNQALYEKIDLTKAWDDPVNAEFRQQMPSVYRCPSDTGPEHHTSYIAVVGNDFVFNGEQARRLEEITDAPEQTLLIVEASGAESFEWMAPRDSDEQLFLSAAAAASKFHSQGRNVIYCDRHVAVLKPMPPTQLRALLTIAAEDEPGDID